MWPMVKNAAIISTFCATLGACDAVGQTASETMCLGFYDQELSTRLFKVISSEVAAAGYRLAGGIADEPLGYDETFYSDCGSYYSISLVHRFEPDLRELNTAIAVYNVDKYTMELLPYEPQ